MNKENNRTCEICGKKYYRRGTRKSVTCSMLCKRKYISKIQTGKTQKRSGKYIVCRVCKKEFYESPCKASTRVYCSIDCRNKDGYFWKNISGKNNYNWKGGTTITKGYVYKLAKSHPNGNKGGRVMEHRLVMEKKLGRYLTKNEEVHHINGIKTDNRIENLEIVIKKTHWGNVKCPLCQKTFKIK